MATILVVDDDEQVRLVLRQLLEGEGHDVLEAADGNAATKLQAGNSVDVVLLDIYMPEKEGLETILDLRSNESGIKIIAMSGGGHMGVDPLRTARKFGARWTVVKPIAPVALLDVVHEALRG